MDGVGANGDTKLFYTRLGRWTGMNRTCRTLIKGVMSGKIRTCSALFKAGSRITGANDGVSAGVPMSPWVPMCGGQRSRSWATSAKTGPPRSRQTSLPLLLL